MKIVSFLLKLMLKILLLPVAFLLRFLCFIWNLLMQLSLWVLSPVMLFVLGCGMSDLSTLTAVGNKVDTKIQNCVWDVRRFILLTNLVID